MTEITNQVTAAGPQDSSKPAIEESSSSPTVRFRRSNDHVWIEQMQGGMVTKRIRVTLDQMNDVALDFYLRMLGSLE